MDDPFNLDDALIRDLPHVRVSRKAPQHGRPCEYVKLFKPEGLGHAGYWIRREYDFLLDFSLKKLKSVVEFATIIQGGDGGQTPIVESVATRDAGLTLQDWLRQRPRYASGDSLRHPFRHAGLFLELLCACLVALREIHNRGIVHCDIKEDNICLPYSPYPLPPGQAVRPDFRRLKLIDFAFSITQDRPLERPLPIGALPEDEENYQSKRLKAALTKDKAWVEGKPIQVQQLDYRVDLYSLGFMAGRILETGLLQPQGAAGHAAVAGARKLVERLKAYDKEAGAADPVLPHDRLIADIDALLAPLEDLEDFYLFTVEGQAQTPPYTPTPLTLIDPEAGQGCGETSQVNVENPPQPENQGDDQPQREPTPVPKKQISHLILEFLLGSGVLLVAYGLAMRSGYLDWTGVCRLLDSDRQIRECTLWPGGGPIWRFSANAPYRTPSLLALSGENSVVSADGLLTIGLVFKQYKVGDSLQIKASVAIPLYLRLYQINEAAKDGDNIRAVFLGDTYKKPIEPGSIATYPPPNPSLSIENTLDTPGQMKLVAIASEKPIPKNTPLLDREGKLTKQAQSLSPTVARLGYEVKGHK